MKVGIIGLGLIGGSFGLDLSSQIEVEVWGFDQDAYHNELALQRGIVSKIKSLEDIATQANVILVSIPVTTMQSLLPTLLDMIKKDTVVIDLGSTKVNICTALKNHKNRGRFIAAHPLAGTEFSGPTAALKGLFRDKKNIICESELSDSDAMEVALKIFNALGLISVTMSPVEHDKHMAYVSHLSHVTSFTLGLTVLDIEQDEKQIFNLAGTGFASTARLAKSNPKTWSAIFNENKSHLITAIDQYMLWLTKFRNAIDAQDTEAMEKYMAKANEMKRILDKN